MSERVRVVVATFGDPTWSDRAGAAIASAVRQTSPCDVVAVHADTLARARNMGAGCPADADWLVFCDGDDCLDPDYVAGMLAGDGDIRQPRTLGVSPEGVEDETANLIPPRGPSLFSGNHLVIGSMVRASFFHQVGGFRDLPMWEDYDLWLRCFVVGASVGIAPAAIYRVGIYPDSRNSQDATTARRVFEDIQRHAHGMVR